MHYQLRPQTNKDAVGRSGSDFHNCSPIAIHDKDTTKTDTYNKSKQNKFIIDKNTA